MERIKRERERQNKKGRRMQLRFVDQGSEGFDRERGLERNREVEHQNKKPSDRNTDRERETGI